MLLNPFLFCFQRFLKDAHRLEKAFNFDTVQSTWPPSWISKKVLRNTYDVRNKLRENIDFLTLRQRISISFEEIVN